MWDFFKNLFGGKKKLKAPPGYFISTSGESQQRIQKLGLTTASEDASDILSLSRLSFPVQRSDEHEYKGDPNLTWLIDIFPPSDKIFDKDTLWKIFDREWRTTYSRFELYGHSPKGNDWHYVIAGDAPSSYDQLQAGWKLAERYIYDEQESVSGEDLKNFKSLLEKKLQQYFPGATLRESEDIPAAVSRSERLSALQKRFGRDMTLVLRSDIYYSGRKAWDALLSVGLKWGDGDLFHWYSDELSNVHELFSVWTATHPGYFFPEDIKAGSFNPRELIFGYSIPRSFDPVQIFDAVVDAAEHCRKTLGGSLVDVEGQPFNPRAERASIMQLVQEMKNAGLEPGSNLALRMF